MATTGFWPVKNRLKEVIDYAENPDKTIDRKYVEKDLYDALQYVSNDKKTDKKMYVSGINCNAKRVYERMTATKKRFGKLGGNMAYHGYQSFQIGEVTPEDAHKIGLETAKRMWGGDYEIVVTTHLNTDNLHNHFVVNSVSFKTGRKFENHISDHYRLREISDAVCLEYGKSVLKESTFYGGEKKEYWLKKQGNLTHREILRGDIDTALAQSTNFKAFELRLKDMGYEIRRDERFAHYSVKAPGWQRAIRLDRLGKEYTPQAIRERLLDNQKHVGYVPFQKPKYTPLLSFEIEYRKMKRMDGIQIIFVLVIELCRLITGNNITKDTPRPLSPAMRQEVVNLNKTLKEYKFLCENHIDSPQELISFIEEKRGQISALEKERQSIYNRNRHKKNRELNAEARAVSVKIKPLREELSLAKAVMEKIPKLKEVLETERQAETAVLTKNKERRHAR
ncbi:hypothetical protein D3Z36_06475 [Lachnospiraceae bacterium]|nr:hypothetical protein [Lachnospiraceae bacterium]